MAAEQMSVHRRWLQPRQKRVETERQSQSRFHESRTRGMTALGRCCRQDELFDMWRTEVKEARDELHEQSPECNISQSSERFQLSQLLSQDLPATWPRIRTSIRNFAAVSCSCLLCPVQVGTNEVRDQPLCIPGKDLAEARENQLHQARTNSCVRSKHLAAPGLLPGLPLCPSFALCSCGEEIQFQSNAVRRLHEDN